VFVTHDPNLKGNVAELAFAAEAAKLGLSVFKPLTEHERYDLVLGLGGRFLRVQCKWAPVRDGVICVRASACRHSPTQGYVRTSYGPHEVDAVGAYCDETGRCYLLPIALCAGRNQIHLRLSRAHNNQRAGINWAASYELGAVAQQEERRHGMAEVGGSNPPSSIPASELLADLKDTVGMDQFYARLAHYVRRAEAGKETTVTRWGRTVARLVPPSRDPSTQPRLLPMPDR
jgi:prevent-host-death family protein